MKFLPDPRTTNFAQISAHAITMTAQQWRKTEQHIPTHNPW